MPAPTEITVPQLSRLIGTPSCPVIIDTRIEEDVQADPTLIPTARRVDFQSINLLAPNLIDHLVNKRVVVYCQKGKKIGQGTASMLRSMDIKAEYLGGGHFAWRDAGNLLIPMNKLPERNSSGKFRSNGRRNTAGDFATNSLWVTRHRPKIDRLACPWLIRRFVDPEARFLFVAPDEVLGVAEKFNAEPFDVENVLWSHRGGRCTFDTMIEEFCLESDALLKLADIVRGADTNRLDLAPQSAGLLAASLGLSRMYRDDLEQLEAGLLLYDAFYRWARDATSETHTWP